MKGTVGKKTAGPRGAGRRRRGRTRWALAALGLLLVIGVTYLGWNYGWGGAASVGDPAPPFVLQDHQGRQVALADYLGRKPIVLAFYMTHT